MGVLVMVAPSAKMIMAMIATKRMEGIDLAKEGGEGLVVMFFFFFQSQSRWNSFESGKEKLY